MTPLHRATIKGYSEVVKMLVDSGANVTEKDLVSFCHYILVQSCTIYVTGSQKISLTAHTSRFNFSP